MKRTVTFTRTGDVDVNSLPDPTTQAPRVVSPAEALHGRYHRTVNFATGTRQEYDDVVRTDCLRTGDRCMSFFHGPSEVMPLIFDGGKWIEDAELDISCPSGRAAHVKFNAELPLPQPLQDPITLLTGHGHQELTGSCPLSTDFDQKFVRTGD